MIRRSSAILAAAAVLAFAPAPAQSQIYLGPEVAWNDDADFGIGAGIEFDLPELYPGITFMGDFLWFFPDGFDYFEFNTNLSYDFPLEESAVTPFALAGLNIGHWSTDNDGPGDGASDTEVGLNLGGGIKFNAGSFQPRIIARFTLGGDVGDFTISGFLPFRIAN